MPSFIAASSSCVLAEQENRAVANRYNITVSGYHAIETNAPSSLEFNKLLAAFHAFCEEVRTQNRHKRARETIICDMFMFTGYHGNYGPADGYLNNLNASQLSRLTQVAAFHKIKFKYIVADCCCSPFGLKRLEGMLASGGEAIGDRMTSTAYKMHDKMMNLLCPIGALEFNAEKALVNSVINETLCSLNAPFYITKLGSKINAVGTTLTETQNAMVGLYSELLVDALGPNPEPSMVLRTLRQGILRDEFRFMAYDFDNSKMLYPQTQEVNERQELLQIRKLNTFVSDYLINGLHMERIEDTNRIGFFRLRHSQGIKLIQKIDKYLSGNSGVSINPDRTQELINEVNAHIDMNIQKKSATSISKTMSKL